METELQDFIQSTFRSVWALELLLFLKRHGESAWTTADLVREMRGSEPVVTQSVATLQAAGLVVQDAEGRFLFAPASPGLRDLADAAEKAYTEKPTAVRRLVLTGPSDKLQTLADAFRLRKD
ncbi:MAG TPA: hypothetical protein VEA41_14950 [Salinarimonas sp.]|jgi:DNA-binding IclR family transcriptional regulator|nr:hypothetical protein [Salinarimonas sp.]